MVWLKDRGGSLINSKKLLSLYVATDPANGAYYVVKANVYDPDNPSGEFASTFGDAAPSTMSQGDAQAYLNKLSVLLGAVDPELL